MISGGCDSIGFAKAFEGDHDGLDRNRSTAYVRDGLRYASDLTEAEVKVIEPLMPPRRLIGRPRKSDLRAVVNAMLYMASTGCQWRQLPRDFPPRSTVQGYFYEWSRSGTFVAIDRMLVMAARESAGRAASPTAGVIDRHR